MTKQEIKSELESLIYVFESLNNDYSALKLKAVLFALEKDWNESDYYALQISNVLNLDETFENLNNIKIR